MFLAVSFAGKFSETLAVSPPGRSRDFLFRPCFTEAETITLPRDGVVFFYRVICARREINSKCALRNHWSGYLVCAEGRYAERTGVEKCAAIFIGPEFGTVSRPDLVAAAREAGDAGFDVLIACAFNYDARSAEFDKLGRVPVLKARMNADLHMAADLKNTGKGTGTRGQRLDRSVCLYIPNRERMVGHSSPTFGGTPAQRQNPKSNK
jgi:hypothetical protein